VPALGALTKVPSSLGVFGQTSHLVTGSHPIATFEAFCVRALEVADKHPFPTSNQVGFIILLVLDVIWQFLSYRRRGYRYLSTVRPRSAQFSFPLCLFQITFRFFDISSRYHTASTHRDFLLLRLGLHTKILYFRGTTPPHCDPEVMYFVFSRRLLSRFFLSTPYDFMRFIIAHKIHLDSIVSWCLLFPMDTTLVHGTDFFLFVFRLTPLQLNARHTDHSAA